MSQTQRRIDAEAAEAADNERRLAQKGWPVHTLDGEIIVADSYYDHSALTGLDRRVLVTEDGKEYVWDTTQKGWAHRGNAAPAADTEPEPDSEPVTDQPGDPLAAELADLTTPEADADGTNTEE